LAAGSLAETHISVLSELFLHNSRKVAICRGFVGVIFNVENVLNSLTWVEDRGIKGDTNLRPRMEKGCVYQAYLGQSLKEAFGIIAFALLSFQFNFVGFQHISTLNSRR